MEVISTNILRRNIVKKQADWPDTYRFRPLLSNVSIVLEMVVKRTLQRNERFFSPSGTFVR